jgi:hypothetical protein
METEMENITLMENSVFEYLLFYVDKNFVLHHDL